VPNKLYEPVPKSYSQYSPSGGNRKEAEAIWSAYQALEHSSLHSPYFYPLEKEDCVRFTKTLGHCTVVDNPDNGVCFCIDCLPPPPPPPAALESSSSSLSPTDKRTQLMASFRTKIESAILAEKPLTCTLCERIGRKLGTLKRVTFEPARRVRTHWVLSQDDLLSLFSQLFEDGSRLLTRIKLTRIEPYADVEQRVEHNGETFIYLRPVQMRCKVPGCSNIRMPYQTVQGVGYRKLTDPRNSATRYTHTQHTHTHTHTNMTHHTHHIT
jgi:hypothetical protein